MNEIAHARYRSYDWDKPFDPSEYRSPKAVTLLYESWLQAETGLVSSQEEIEQLKAKVTQIDKSHALLRAELDSLNSRKWVPFVLQLIAAICAGIGVNIITGQDNLIYGWSFVSISVMLEVIAFFALR